MWRRFQSELSLVVVLLVLGAAATVVGANVSHDHCALVVDGKRKVLFLGSIHYPHSTPEKPKDGSLDVIETYVFWNIHEPFRNQYDFEGRKDLDKFVKTVANPQFKVFTPDDFWPSIVI
ncbi:hypothetical protein MLD38_025248 [Melastoma candidum]|uniref:Uncharacterized protein n=1 Tax=Melastoma candidum TaxID=119954 RepID=A0ACB9NUQ4_9MYRT|nr:hypothetical protein MLD38_025248 [Melastoma candidum]